MGLFRVSTAFFVICVLIHLECLAAENTDSNVPKQSETEGSAVVDKAKQTIKDTASQVDGALSVTKDKRQNGKIFFYGNYSPIDLLIPSKLGFTLGTVRNSDKTWEVEYLRGSLSVPFIVEDLGKMTDERISLIGRAYFGGNSFNLSYGLSYFIFSMHLGDKLLNGLTGGVYPSIDLVDIQSYGFNIGIGNRWIFKNNVTFGVDWISWAQPVAISNKKSAFLDYSTNQQNKDDVDKAIKTISYFPRFVIFKLQLGIIF